MTTTVHIRLAFECDATDIGAMSRDQIEHGLPWTWKPERVALAIGAPDTNVAVVREGRILLGFGIMEYLDNDAYLVLFAVRPSHQRQGIGSKLLRWLEASARAAGAQKI
jgi:ribosomal-protein-alanine N-acetyltransferase